MSEVFFDSPEPVDPQNFANQSNEAYIGAVVDQVAAPYEHAETAVSDATDDYLRLLGEGAIQEAERIAAAAPLTVADEASLYLGDLYAMEQGAPNAGDLAANYLDIDRAYLPDPITPEDIQGSADNKLFFGPTIMKMVEGFASAKPRNAEPKPAPTSKEGWDALVSDLAQRPSSFTLEKSRETLDGEAQVRDFLQFWGDGGQPGGSPDETA
jgi:hypothetical protein